jgi:RimJ/RimL family protein N-acetyltransferase
VSTFLFVKNTGTIGCEKKVDHMLNSEEVNETNGVPNWGRYNYPLACRILKETDAPILYPAMKKSAKNLKGFIGWAKYAPSWNISEVQKFVRDHCEDEFPRFHLIFSIGYEVVGFGSIAPMPRNREVQVALWVTSGYERQGIGSWIVYVLEWYAFHVFGYDAVYYQVDSSNKKSASLPQHLGFTFSHTFEDEIHAKDETGFWYSFKKNRPEELPPGFIDTGILSNWDGHTFPWKSLI